MPACVAFHCTNRRDKSVAVSGKTFHRFPFRNNDLVEKWATAVRRENWRPTKSSVLCSNHFEEKCFDRTGQTVRLREGSIPTVFQFSPHLLTKKHVPITPKKHSASDPTLQTSSAIAAPPPPTLALPGLSSVYVDHHCFASAPSLKRKLSKEFKKKSSVSNKLKLIQHRVKRLQRRVHSLQEVYETFCSRHAI